MLSLPSEPSAELLADIRSRLGHICESYDVEEFNDLVRQIASVRVKYDALRNEAFFDAVLALSAERMAKRFPAPRDRMAEFSS